MGHIHKRYQPLLAWSATLLLLFLAACGGGTTPDFSQQEGVRVDVFSNLGRSADSLNTQGVPVDPETGETGVARAVLQVSSGGTQLFFRDGRVVNEAEGEEVVLTPEDSNVTLSLPEGTYTFALTASDNQNNVLAKGEVEQQVGEDSSVSIPLTSLIGSARFEVPESVKANEVFDAFLQVSPPNRPDLRVPLGDFSASYEVAEPSVQLEGSSDIGVRVAAACDSVEVSVTVDNDLSDAVSASASIPVNDEACDDANETPVGADLVPPFVSITTPEEGATVNSSFTVQGDVNDQQSGVDKVEVYEGTLKLGEADIDSDAMTWSFDAELDDGSYTLIAVAFDKAGNSSRAQVKVNVKEGAGGGADNCTNPVEIPNTRLEFIVREALGKLEGALTCQDLASLTEIVTSEPTGDDDVPITIESLEGLQYAVNLRTLSIEGVFLEDFSQIEGLKSLRTLVLIDLSSSDANFEPIRALTNLEELRLSSRDAFSVEIGDLTPFQNLAKLKVLEIGGLLAENGTADLTPLGNLTNLIELNLNFSPNLFGEGASSPAFLETLSKLETLRLESTGASELSGLRNLSNLKNLFLEGNEVSNLTPLQNLSNLEDLSLRFNNVSDLAPLQRLPNLKSLDLRNNAVSDISPLVDNEGVNSDDYVRLNDNPLGTCPGTEGREDIEALQERGVFVDFDEPENCSGDGGDNGGDNGGNNGDGTITVTSTSSAASLEGECTLRAAITAANTDTAVGGCPAGEGADTVVLAETTYTLTEVDNQTEGPNGLPSITSEITLEGNGALIERLRGSRDNAEFRLFYVAEEGTLILDGVALQGGGLLNEDLNESNRGGAVFNRGDLSLLESSVTNNTAIFASAINNVGTLFVRNGNIDNNRAEAEITLYNIGTATLDGVTLSNNEADNSISAVLNDKGGKLTVRNSTISGNSDDGSAFVNGGEATFERVTYTRNFRKLLNTGKMTITDSTVSESGQDGFVNIGEMTFQVSVFENNLNAFINEEGATLKLSGSTVSGTVVDDGMVFGLLNEGTAVVEQSIISGNPGGGISNSGTLTVAGSTLQENGTSDSVGGGIYNQGTATLRDNLITKNSGFPAGVYNDTAGDLTIENTRITDQDDEAYGMQNRGRLVMKGGELSRNSDSSCCSAFTNYEEGTATFDGTLIEGNDGQGSVFNNAGELGFVNVTYRNNVSGVRNSGTFTVTKSSISDNNSSDYGILNLEGGTLILTDSTVSGNGEFEGGAGIFNSGTAKIVGSSIQENGVNDEDFDLRGVGITNEATGTLTLSESNVSGNAGGGVLNSGTAEIITSTVQGNGPSSDGIVNAEGGTLAITQSLVNGNGSYGVRNGGSMSFTNNTVINNFTGGIKNLETGKLDVAFSSIFGFGSGFITSISNEADAASVTVFATFLDTEFDFGCPNPVTSKGYNFFDFSEPCSFDQETDIVGGAFPFGPLQGNGGPTLTRALEEGSVAVDHIPADVCSVDTDQRGVSRPQGEACDIGAFELAQ